MSDNYAEGFCKRCGRKREDCQKIIDTGKRCTDNITEPNYANQLLAAQKLLANEGPGALYNPHALIGRTCRCRDCFCCAANEVLASVVKI
jgi:hypothetical protein